MQYAQSAKKVVPEVCPTGDGAVNGQSIARTYDLIIGHWYPWGGKRENEEARA